MDELKASFLDFLTKDQGLAHNGGCAGQYAMCLAEIGHDLIEAIPEGSNLMQEVHNQGLKSHFVNFKISHIWGNAWHPLYFTSLWNIVLVPSYINDILDKAAAKKHLNNWPCRLYDTLQAIIIKLYGLKSYDWKHFDGLDKTTSTKATELGTYYLKLINPKSPGQKEPEISIKAITI